MGSVHSYKIQFRHAMIKYSYKLLKVQQCNQGAIQVYVIASLFCMLICENCK